MHFKTTSGIFGKAYILLCFLIALVFNPGTSAAQVIIREYSPATATTRAQDSLLAKSMFEQYDSVEVVNPEMGMVLLSRIIEIGKRRNFPRAVFLGISNLGMDLQEQGKNEKSIEVLKQALPYMLVKENVQYADKIFNKIGQAYCNMGNYDSALFFYNASLASLKNVGKRKSNTDSADVYNHISLVFMELREDRLSLDALHKARELAIRKKDSSMVALAAVNAVGIYIDRGDLDTAEALLEMGRLYDKRNGYRQIQILQCMAVIADERKQYEKALSYLDEAASYLERIDKARIELLDRYNLKSITSRIYIHQKEYTKAINILTEAYDLAKKAKYADGLRTTGHNLAIAYARAGMHTHAYEMIKLYSARQDSLYKKEKNKTLEASMEARTVDQDRAIVSQQLFIAEQEEQLRRKNIWMSGSLLILLILVSVSIPVIRNYRQKQVLQQSVFNELKHKQEIEQLKAQVRGEEQERRRIAQELHDNIASQLLSVNKTMENIQYNEIDDKTYDDGIAVIFQKLTLVTQDVRKTAHSLMPDLLLEEGLSTALASVCEKIKGSTEMEIDFQEYGMLPIIDKDIELSIYRMVQELVRNVLIHAKDATHLLVQVSCIDILLSITIEDNGASFRDNNEGNGLQQVRERVKALRGHFDLHHSPGKGTTAYLEFDMQHWL